MAGQYDEFQTVTLTVNGAQTSPVVDLLSGRNKVPSTLMTQHQFLTATPTTWTAQLQGSLDGTNWFQLHALAQTDASQTIKWAVDKPVRYVRLSTSALTLNTCTGVKVIIAGVSYQ